MREIRRLILELRVGLLRFHEGIRRGITTAKTNLKSILHAHHAETNNYTLKDHENHLQKNPGVHTY